MYNFIIGLINNLIKGVATLLTFVINLLPTSPFSNLSYSNIDYNNFLSWFNTFLPIDSMLAHLLSFISILSVYYLYQVIMRYIKLIGE